MFCQSQVLFLGYGQISLVVLKTSLLCKQIYMASENNDGQNEKKSFILLSLSSYVFLSSYSIVNFDSARSNSNEKLHQHILLSEQRLNLISTPSVFQRCKFFFFGPFQCDNRLPQDEKNGVITRVSWNSRHGICCDSDGGFFLESASLAAAEGSTLVSKVIPLLSLICCVHVQMHFITNDATRTNKTAHSLFYCYDRVRTMN